MPRLILEAKKFNTWVILFGLQAFVSLTIVGLSFSVQAIANEDLSSAIGRSRTEKWSDDIQWQRLLQYQPRFFGGVKSQSGSDKFFLHPQGATQPQLELEASIEALFENKRLITSRDSRFKESVACVFPARRLWLEKKIGQKLTAISCERFERFKEILQAKSLTYVFSSYYLNNPASGFGHTFLRINKAPSAKDGERYELADYGIGYAAMQISSNPLVYSLLGISGFMPGAFDVNPYYFKVREYNDFESRDLWEYDLNFTPNEVDFIVAVIWELSDVSFDYHYFSQNCSYRILAVLETARPELHLIDQLKTQVMPADTVQTIFEVPNLVSHIHFRPSVRATFQGRFALISEEAKARIKSFAKTESTEDLVKGLPVDTKREVLDASMDYLDFRYPNDILKKTGKYSLKKEVLAARAEVGGISNPISVAVPWAEAPHDAQGSRRFGIGFRKWPDEKPAMLLSYKFALHDLLDPKLGYPSGAQISMGDFAFGFDGNTRILSLEKAVIFEVISLSSIDDFSSHPSWRLKIANERSFENDCSYLCNVSELSGGIGLTKTWFSALDFSLWLRAGAQQNPNFERWAFRAGVGPAAMIRFNQKSFSLLAETYFRYDYLGSFSEFRQNLIGAQLTPKKNWAVRINLKSENSKSSFDSQLFYYY